jgi:hypothetical protein
VSGHGRCARDRSDDPKIGVGSPKVHRGAPASDRCSGRSGAGRRGISRPGRPSRRSPRP